MQWISTQSELEYRLNSLCNKPLLAIDTEFIYRNTYFPIPALIQISDGESVLLIDPCSKKITNWNPLKELIEDENIIKVIHSLREDIKILYLLTNSIPKNIFDTQIAAHFLNYGEQLSYQNLLEILLNKKIDKLHTLINWRKRPLSNSELKYACEDVIYLSEIYYKLIYTDVISSLIYEETQYNIVEILDSINNDASLKHPHLKWKHLNLNKQQSYWLSVLLAWRDKLAKKRNIIINRILSNNKINFLVISDNIDILKKKLDNEKIYSFFDNDVEYIKFKNELYDSIPNNFIYLDNTIERQFIKNNKKVINALQDVVNKKSIELNLPTNIIARRKDLIEFLTYLKHESKLTKPKILLSWRKKLIGNLLLNVVKDYPNITNL